jgi:hypothetical protein
MRAVRLRVAKSRLDLYRDMQGQGATAGPADGPADGRIPARAIGGGGLGGWGPGYPRRTPSTFRLAATVTLSRSSCHCGPLPPRRHTPGPPASGLAYYLQPTTNGCGSGGCSDEESENGSGAGEWDLSCWE